jgi:hypothetical protein
VFLDFSSGVICCLYCGLLCGQQNVLTCVLDFFQGLTASFLDMTNATADGCGAHPGPAGHWEMALQVVRSFTLTHITSTSLHLISELSALLTFSHSMIQPCCLITLAPPSQRHFT